MICKKFKIGKVNIRAEKEEPSLTTPLLLLHAVQVLTLHISLQ